MPTIEALRKAYHAQVCENAIFIKAGDIPSMADISNKLSRTVSRNLMNHLNYAVSESIIDGQSAGSALEQATKKFLRDAFEQIKHLRPGAWRFSLHDTISDFDQYQHLRELDDLKEKEENKALRSILSDYAITPDIVVSRSPVSDEEINQGTTFLNRPDLPRYTPLRAQNQSAQILHASISCKWTIRSDRSQNARTEGLNLIRNRKGNTPHIAVVTGEPLPSRIASLALGTGDIDCVYHFALPELVLAVQETKELGTIDLLQIMIDGKRLRDISDLPFDLAI